MSTEIRVACFAEPGFGENAYVLWVHPKGPCWIIDPGPPPSAAEIGAHIREHALRPEAVLLTHGHADHIAGIPEILKAFDGLPVYIAIEEKSAFTDPNDNLSADLGVPITVDVGETRDLSPGSALSLDGSRWRVLDTSGHSPGGRSLYCPDAGTVIVGDALFQLSIGRTDFHHSDTDTLIRNIRENLFTLPDATKVFCGHGPATTIGDEKRANPFLQA